MPYGACHSLDLIPQERSSLQPIPLGWGKQWKDTRHPRYDSHNPGDVATGETFQPIHGLTYRYIKAELVDKNGHWKGAAYIQDLLSEHSNEAANVTSLATLPLAKLFIHILDLLAGVSSRSLLTQANTGMDAVSVKRDSSPRV